MGGLGTSTGRGTSASPPPKPKLRMSQVRYSLALTSRAPAQNRLTLLTHLANDRPGFLPCKLFVGFHASGSCPSASLAEGPARYLQ